MPPLRRGAPRDPGGPDGGTRRERQADGTYDHTGELQADFLKQETRHVWVDGEWVPLAVCASGHAYASLARGVLGPWHVFQALIEHHYAGADPDNQRILGWVSHVLDVLVEPRDRAACAAVLRDTSHATWPALRSGQVVESLDAALAPLCPDWPHARVKLPADLREFLFLATTAPMMGGPSSPMGDQSR